MANSFMPVSDADRVLWMQGFNAALTQYATTLGLTAAELQNVQRDIAYYIYTVQVSNDARQYLQALRQYMLSMRSNTVQATVVPMPTLPVVASPPPAVPPGIIGRINTLVLRIRRAAGYTAAIGQALNIIPPVAVFNPADAIPEFTIRLDGGHPFLKWKKGVFDGMVVYVDRDDGNGFVQLVHTVKTGYLDVTALPANAFSVNWSYKIHGFIGDDEVGQFSEVITITVIRV